MDMNNYYVVINDNEYSLSKVIFLDMDNEIVNYINVLDNKKYINMDGVRNDGNYYLLKKMYDRCNSYVGMFFVDTVEGEEFSKLGYEFRKVDRLSDYNYKKGNITNACDLLIRGIELSIKPYNDILNKEIKNKIIR